MGRLEQEKSALMAQMITATPLGRVGQAEEIARAIRFLCSADASFITGVDLLVDGSSTNALLQMKASP